MKDIEILANAPEGATLTCTICEDKQRLYIDNLDMLANGVSTFWTIDGKEFDAESRYTTFNDDLQPLSDIQTIVDLRRENAELEKEREAILQEAKIQARELDTQKGIIQSVRDLFDIRVHDFNLISAIKLKFEAHNLEQQTQAIKQACEYAQVSLFETSEAIPDDYEGRHQKQGALAFKGRCLVFAKNQLEALKESK